jgi:hypothetical protein
MQVSYGNKPETTVCHMNWLNANIYLLAVKKNCVRANLNWFCFKNDSQILHCYDDFSVSWPTVISGEYWSHGLLMIYIYNDGSEWIVDHIAIVTLSRFFFKLLFCRSFLKQNQFKLARTQFFLTASQIIAFRNGYLFNKNKRRNGSHHGLSTMKAILTSRRFWFVSITDLHSVVSITI